MKRVTLSIVLVSTLVACDPNRVYEQNIDLKEALWVTENNPEFVFNIEDPGALYNIQINLRHAVSYPFHNIYVKYNLRDSSRSILASELMEFYLFDVKTGKPQGDGMGDIFDNRFELHAGYRFPHPGSYSVDLQQFMRLDTLPMILSVGVRVEGQD